MPGLVYRFGPFELDADHRRLLRGGTRVPLPGRAVDVLLILAAQASQIVDKETLTDGAWRDAAVTANSLPQAISSLRHALGAREDGKAYIETIARRGYRLAATVECIPVAPAPPELEDLLAPYRALVAGRAALERLDLAALALAQTAFAEALRVDPDNPGLHVGRAHAYLLQFESTRADVEPDRAALQQAHLTPAKPAGWIRPRAPPGARWDGRVMGSATRKTRSPRAAWRWRSTPGTGCTTCACRW